MNYKNYEEQSVFTPENLLREARRQKLIGECSIPSVCILDPDGDIVEYLQKNNQLKLCKCWACYHTKLYSFNYESIEFGIIGYAVGASFAVLIAEELFATDCKLLISISSAGQIATVENSSRFLLIENAIRDEGTSYHYLPPLDISSVNSHILKKLKSVFKQSNLSIAIGKSWTTDAPFRETKSAIECAKNKGAMAVEMEAAALYSFAKAKQKNVVCFAHLTNTMGQKEGDFEKGEANGSIEALKLIHLTAKNLLLSLK
ncbi:MAG: nucleoside phosphorylase [Actinobacteria bacterium]|nr:nucleoside phosphorylase [Actinomycetota bacterium]